jgi:hypothetical protein
MSEGRRGGERRQHAPSSVCTQARHERSYLLYGDASFARSFDPCTLILTMLRGASPGGEASAAVSRSGKPARAGGTGTGVVVGGRRAARRMAPLPQGRGVTCREKEGGRGLRPCENRRARVWLPARQSLLQKSVGDVWPQINSANALQKERSGSSERGPSAERASAGETVVERAGRSGESRVGLTGNTGEDRPKTQGGERSSSSGFHIATSGAGVAGPGL